MKWEMALVLCAAAMHAQTGSIAGRITGQGAGPVRGEVTAFTGGGALQIRNATTDDQGSFTIEIPAGEALLVARAEGYVSEERRLLVRPGPGNGRVQFSLARAGSVSGRVFDETGAGVPGARVWITYAGETRAWRLADEAGGEAADAFGYFQIPVVAQGRPFQLHAESDSRLPSSSGTLVLRTNEMAGAVLLLSRRGTTVRGRVVDGAGDPVGGAAIHLRALPAGGESTAGQRASFAFARSANKTTVSAADGSFAFTAIPDGRAVVTARAGARRASGEAATVAGRDVEIVLALR
jgi:hypothetical protein